MTEPAALAVILGTVGTVLVGMSWLVHAVRSLSPVGS